MGLFYSITQIVHSYIYPSNSLSINPETIKLFCKKLVLGIQQKLYSLKKNNFKLQTDFINRINTEKKRDKFNQNILIDHMIMQAIKCGVYEELLDSTKRIDHEAHIISSGLDKVSQECIAAIFAVVHLYKDFQLDQFIDLKEFIPEPYPVIGVDKLDQNMKRFLKYKQPTEYERNLYVVEMCKRHEGKMSILKLNEVNHAFSQYPETNKKQKDELNSNGLYARSASYQVDEQQLDKRKERYERQMEDFAA